MTWKKLKKKQSKNFASKEAYTDGTLSPYRVCGWWTRRVVLFEQFCLIKCPMLSLSIWTSRRTLRNRVTDWLTFFISENIPDGGTMNANLTKQCRNEWMVFVNTLDIENICCTQKNFCRVMERSAPSFNGIRASKILDVGIAFKWATCKSEQKHTKQNWVSQNGWTKNIWTRTLHGLI